MPASAYQRAIVSKVLGESTRIGTVFGGTVGTEKATGATNEDAFTSATQMILFDLVMTHGGKAMTKITSESFAPIRNKLFRIEAEGESKIVSVNDRNEIVVYNKLENLPKEIQDKLIDGTLVAKDGKYRVRITKGETVLQSSKILSDETTREAFRKRLWGYDSLAQAVEKLKIDRPELKNIPTEDLAAVKAYTGELYEYVNDTLRTKNPSELKDIDSIVKCADSGLNQLPSYNGVVYRGVNLNNLPAILAKYKKGEFVTEEAFTSSSRDKNIRPKKDTLMIIYSKNGKEISFLSTYKQEQEVLFKTNSKFMVESVQINSQGRREIIMREIEEKK